MPTGKSEHGMQWYCTSVRVSHSRKYASRATSVIRGVQGVLHGQYTQFFFLLRLLVRAPSRKLVVILLQDNGERLREWTIIHVFMHALRKDMIPRGYMGNTGIHRDTWSG
jgi:hypothetical protein